jgi:hypothetical protein
MPDSRPIDGTNIGPILRRESTDRNKVIPYRFLESRKKMYGAPTFAMMDSHTKFLTNLADDHADEMVFDLHEDPGETRDIAGERRSTIDEMRVTLTEFAETCRRSHRGEDYPDDYQPVNSFQEVTGGWKE